MIIHNFFSDLLVSCRSLLDNVIFSDKKRIDGELKTSPSNFIKNYEFNISNRTFTLSKNDYKTNYEFPSCIISLNDEQYSFGERPNTIQHIPVENINQIPILVDSQTGDSIHLQEEHIQVPIAIQINCESPLQAKEIEFTIKRWLPLNKYIQLFDFTSFLEISPVMMLSLEMDFNQREIYNLFTKRNRETGEFGYYYSIRYYPIVRLESSSVSISDNSMKSFPVNIELMYQVQMPIWICSLKNQIIEKINLDFQRFGNEPISINPCRSIFDRNNPNEKILRNLIIPDLEDYDFRTLESIDNSDYIFSMKFNPNDFKLEDNFKYNFFGIDGSIKRDVKPILFDRDQNEIRFTFTENEYKNFYKAELTNPLIVQFIRKT